MSTTTKTVREVYEALAKNGFDHLRGMWFRLGDNVGGCILAQAGFNLGVIITTDDYSAFGLDEWVEQANYEDEPIRTLHGALNRFKVDPDHPKYLRTAITRGIGDQILYWNDLTERDETGADVYVLKTYKDVADVAYELLEPFMDETVELSVYDYAPHFKVAV